MRTEQEMYELIINTAKQDDRIRAVYMNGSRTNPNVPKDIFQDYDVVYVVTDTKPYIQDRTWIDRFGDRLFMQYPDENPDYPSDKENFYGWLMQFADGNRIDLHVESIAHAKEHILDDKLCKVLLDKDHLFPEIPPSTDEDYRVTPPTEQQYLCTCNEFWWCLNNVIPYAQDMMNFIVRKQLERMLSWKVGIKTEFAVSVGKSAKYMYRWLTKEEWDGYLSTYAVGTVGDCWRATFRMCDLFDDAARYVGKKLGYCYNEDEAKNGRKFLEHVKDLPKDAAGETSHATS